MKKLCVLLLMLPCCGGHPLSVSQTRNPDFKVEFLFEHEGCKVYRFDDGYNRYFTNCSGSTQWTRHEGKMTRHESVEGNDSN